MSIDDGDGMETVVLRFFNARSGVLRCRVTDVASQETWITPDAPALRELLHKRAGTSVALQRTELGGEE